MEHASRECVCDSFVEALAETRRVYAGDHGEVVTSLNNLAMFYHATAA